MKPFINWFGVNMSIEKCNYPDATQQCRSAEVSKQPLQTAKALAVEQYGATQGTVRRDYRGEFVVLERNDPKSQNLEYGSGEYLVVDQTPNSLYAVKPEVGYNGHEIKSFTIAGSHPWQIVRVTRDDNAAARFAYDQLKWSNFDTSKKQWVEYVYTNAKRTAEKVIATLQDRGFADFNRSQQQPSLVSLQIADLQRQVADLVGRVNDLEAWKAEIRAYALKVVDAAQLKLK